MQTIKIEDKVLQDFHEYSSYVNNERAIAHFYDGLKPVMRKILYVMYNMKLFPDKQTKKCASIVGQTMEFHPHGKQ